MSEIGDDDSVFDLLPEFRLTPEERAVIEAARELERELADCYVPPGKAWDAWERFHAAMAALEEAEGRDE